MSNSNEFAPPKDKYIALHEAMLRDTDVTDEDITSELRSMGSILETVSEGQRRELDLISLMRPTKSGVRKLSRRAKKAQRKGR